MRQIVILSILILISSTHSLIAQSNDFIKIKTSKPLGIFSFIEAASHQRATSFTYQELIDSTYFDDERFADIIDQYKNLKIEFNIKFDGYPEARKQYVTTKDIIWQAVSKSDDLEEVSDRIVGVIPHNVQVELMNLLREIEPYYTNMVWNNVQAQIARIENQLENRKETIKRLFLAASKFYNVNWDESIPFLVALYPIPLERAMTTAIPKGNTLICGFLSENEEEYKGLIGVIVHEMCHILYSAQSIEFQEEMDKWFCESTSPYAKLAYNYADEGLATVIGNGWSFKEINGKLDENGWYFDEYIDGFARAMYDYAASYLNNNKTIDKEFVEMAIVSFAEKFPKSIYDIEILMNSVVIFSSTEEEQEINQIFGTIMDNFSIRSAQLSSPFDAVESRQFYHSTNDTKLYFIHEDHAKAIEYVESIYGDLNADFNSTDRGYFCFSDEKSKTPVLLVMTDSIEGYQQVYDLLKSDKYLKFGVFRSL